MTAVLDHAPTTVFRATGDLTADSPPESRGLARDGVRLLVATQSADGTVHVEHTTFSQIGAHLRPGDALVVNTSATVAGEVDGRVPGRGAVVVHVAGPLEGGGRVIELRTAPDAAHPVLDARVGDVVELTGTCDDCGGTHLALRLVAPYPEPGSSPTGRGNRLWRAVEVLTGEDDGSVVPARAGRSPGHAGPGLDRVGRHLAVHGRPIAYGYLRRRYGLDAYQTVFGTEPGSAEMASAGRPFTPELVTALVTHGVHVVPVTLHTGFSSQEAGEAPQPEAFAVSASSAAVVNEVRARGGRVVAVGTTATRALESAADESGTVRPASGWTDLVISPGRPVRVVDGLVTGWHDPEASHLLLVEQVAGPRLTQRAYDEAVAHRYAWHEFGDSGLFLPPRRSV